MLLKKKINPSCFFVFTRLLEGLTTHVALVTAVLDSTTLRRESGAVVCFTKATPALSLVSELFTSISQVKWSSKLILPNSRIYLVTGL